MALSLLNLQPLLLPSLRSPVSTTAAKGGLSVAASEILPLPRQPLAQKSRAGCDARLVSGTPPPVLGAPEHVCNPLNWVASALHCQPS